MRSSNRLLWESNSNWKKWVAASRGLITKHRQMLPHGTVQALAKPQLSAKNQWPQTHLKRTSILEIIRTLPPMSITRPCVKKTHPVYRVALLWAKTEVCHESQIAQKSNIQTSFPANSLGKLLKMRLLIIVCYRNRFSLLGAIEADHCKNPTDLKDLTHLWELHLVPEVAEICR